jgi:hypothetical protein
MSDEPTTIDWNLHMTRGHTPMKDWEKRNSLDHYFSAHADEWLVRVAPMFREEVIRLRDEVKKVRGLEKTISNYLSFALTLLTDEQDCEYTHFVGGDCTHDCCPEREEE